MKTVWKYPIPVDDVVAITMPKGAEILHVSEQHGTPTMWVLVDPLEPVQARQFRFAGTGHPIEDHHAVAHVGSFFMQGGALVFHLFETKASLIENDIAWKQRFTFPTDCPAEKV